MTRHTTTVLVATAAIAVACGRSSVGDRRSGTDSYAARNGMEAKRTSELAQSSLIGCLRPGDEPGSYTLQVAADTASGAAGTSGSTAEGRSPNTSSTTGAGGDVVRNSPTIGGGVAPRAYRVVMADANSGDPVQNVGRQVSVVGVIEDNATANGVSSAAGATGTEPIKGATGATRGGAAMHTIRASSITKTADRCATDAR